MEVKQPWKIRRAKRTMRNTFMLFARIPTGREAIVVQVTSDITPSRTVNIFYISYPTSLLLLMEVRYVKLASNEYY